MVTIPSSTLNIIGYRLGIILTINRDLECVRAFECVKEYKLEIQIIKIKIGLVGLFVFGVLIKPQISGQTKVKKSKVRNRSLGITGETFYGRKNRTKKSFVR